MKDDEKIDADALLDTLKKGDGPGNEERQRLGVEPITTDGWRVPRAALRRRHQAPGVGHAAARRKGRAGT